MPAGGDFKGSSLAALRSRAAAHAAALNASGSTTTTNNAQTVQQFYDYSPETTLGLLQSLVDGSSSAAAASSSKKNPIRLCLLFAHHSEPLRDLATAGPSGPAGSVVRSLTTLTLSLSPFPQSSSSSSPSSGIGGLEDGEAARAVCRAPVPFADFGHYATLMSNTGLCPPKASTILAWRHAATAASGGGAAAAGGGGGSSNSLQQQNPHRLLIGQQSQLPPLDSRNEKRIIDALQKSLAKVSEGSLSVFPPPTTSSPAPSPPSSPTSAAEGAAAERERQLLRTAARLPLAMRLQGPIGLLTPPLIDLLLSSTSGALRAADGRGPLPPISSTNGKESSTTTTANHIAEAVKQLLLFETFSSPSSSPAKESSGSLWPTFAFLQHLLIILDTHRPPIVPSSSQPSPSPPSSSRVGAPANAARAVVMNPYAGDALGASLLPLFHALGGIGVELVIAENTRREAEAARLAAVAAAGEAALAAEAERNAFLEGEEARRQAIEEEEQAAYDELLAAAIADKQRIVLLLLEQQRLRELARQQEEERLAALAARFAKIFTRLQEDEAARRAEVAAAEVAALRLLYTEHCHERLLVAQFLARDAMRKAERPERIELWAAEKRQRTVLYHSIRAAQMALYVAARQRDHEAAHKQAYLGHVRAMGEIATIGDRLTRLQYVRGRLAEEVAEKEAKFLNRPHADALAHVVDAIVSRHGPQPPANGRLLHSFSAGGGGSGDPTEGSPYGSLAFGGCGAAAGGMGSAMYPPHQQQQQQQQPHQRRGARSRSAAGGASAASPQFESLPADGGGEGIAPQSFIGGGYEPAASPIHRGAGDDASLLYVPMLDRGESGSRSPPRGGLGRGGAMYPYMHGGGSGGEMDYDIL